MTTPSLLSLFDRLHWIDGTPLANHVEPYRRRIFEQVFEERDEAGRPRYNLILCGRAKKNYKSADLVLAELLALFDPSSGRLVLRKECYLVAFDEDQAANDLDLLKLLIRVNPTLQKYLSVQSNVVLRKDGFGFVKVLPGQSYLGEHGRTFRLLGIDEIHTQKDWNLLEALQPDPTRLDSQTWITSYASLYHKPGVPLFDLCAAGRAGTDPRMLFSWYGADYTTDPDYGDADPETRANPSRGLWADTGYLEQQRRRLPAHKFRRLHMNLPGLPEGSAFQPEPVMAAVARGKFSLPWPDGCEGAGFVDMCGGSNDDAVLAVGYKDPDEHAVVCRVLSQGQPPPFDPRLAVERFAGVLKEHDICTVTGDAYAGQTFRADFERHGINYEVSSLSASKLYEALEPALNGHLVVLPDVPEVEQQLLGLVWRCGKIDHAAGEHDDYSNAVAGLVHKLIGTEEIELRLLHPAPRSANEVQAEADKEFEERYQAAKNAVTNAIRTQGVFWS